ncbi:MAG TPA: hypothetical protein EYP58_00435 [bacterium (Candidatus Stahlbacteria)]|nr:hypothetical protein [Candidatus Stahlbacteria bacterium]
MDEIGKVIEANGNEVKIELGVSDHCTNCSMAKFCITTGSGKRVIIARNAIGVKVDDIVRVRMEGGKQVGSILLVFGLPILLGIIGLFLGARYSDTASLIGGIIGLGVGIIILKFVENLFAKKNVPEIIEICKED